MRKTLLLLIMFGIVLVNFGQNLKSFDINKVEKMPVCTPDPAGGNAGGPVAIKKLTEANIGLNWYDLQTYGSMAQRMYAYPDGTVGAAWMMGFMAPNWEDRGIGYNYYDGSSWGAEPTESIASIRTGWACYAPLGENGEVAMAYALPDADWVLLFCKREMKGTGPWEEFTLEGPEAGVGLVWPDMVTNGTDHNTIHVLARAYGSPYMGQENGALLYSRSTDGGQTWDIQNHFFPELGYDYFTAIDADGYAWAKPKGNTLAFSVGFDAGHGCIMKSTDNGDTWTFTEVFHCPFYPPPGGATPTFGAGDGAHACAIDNNGMVHVVYGRMRHVYDDTGAGFYYPGTDGLIYWNESMPALDTTIISSYTLEYLAAAGNLIGWVVDPGIAGLIDIPAYFQSLTCWPQMTIDENNRIFVLWSGIVPGFDNGVYNYRHIYGNASNDDGVTWEGMKDFNQDIAYIFSECIFPVLSPDIVDNKFHFYFENDNEPGEFVWAASQAQAGDNYITYMSHPTDFLTGIGNHDEAATTFSVTQNYPNPFRDFTYIDVMLTQPSDVDFSVADITGRVIYSQDYGYISNDKLRIKYENDQLPGGVYYYTVKTGNGSFTGKMMVQ